MSSIVVSTLLIAVASVVAGPQEKPQTRVPSVEKAEPSPPDSPPSADEKDERQKASEKVEKLIAAYDLKPRPLTPIPDDPPPHEGALIDLPWVVEPPDLIIVEVLEALPGRPISGERLVRPDGTINIGFYGDIHVRGLTLPQIKVAILKRLRNHLADETLGLISSPESEAYGFPPESYPPRARKSAIPDLDEGRNPFDKLDEPRPSPDRPNATKTRSSMRPEFRGHVPVRRVRSRGTRVDSQELDLPPKEQTPVKIEGLGKGGVTITIEIDGQSRPVAEPVQEVSPPLVDYKGPWRVIPPEESGRVFVDITAYNSKNYYILGDVLVPGKLPWTGNETVLDALQYANGLLPTAEPKDIRLIRPGRGGKPAKVYKIDLEAIQDKGDVRPNYQLFPGDRLIVGRNEVVKKTVEIDRLTYPIEAIAGSIQRIANSIRAVQTINQADTDEIMKELVDFWAKEISRKGDVKLDEATLREALLQKRKAAPAPEPKKQP